MAKKIDYSKVKAMAQSILECIGDDEDVGENPSLPDPDTAIGDGGQNDQVEIMSEDNEGEGVKASSDSDSDDSEATPDNQDKKKKRDSALAMMGAMMSRDK